jgi:hypothetical protein
MRNYHCFLGNNDRCSLSCHCFLVEIGEFGNKISFNSVRGYLFVENEINKSPSSAPSRSSVLLPEALELAPM